MAFSKARRLGDLITANAEQFITSAHITDTAITGSDIHSTFDLTGKTVTVATASAGDNDTSVASTAFVQQEIASLVDSAPGTLNTLNELAAALGDDANFSTTVTNSIATKLPLAGGTLTGGVVIGGDSSINRGNQTSGELLIGGTTDGGFIDFDGTSLQINTQRDPNTGTFINTSKSNARIELVGADGDAHIKFRTIDSNNTSATERMRIDKNGDVGINMDPAGYGKLSVNGTGVLLALRASSGGGRLGFYEGGAGRFYLDSLDGSDGLKFVDGDGSSERMRISDSGFIQMYGNVRAGTALAGNGVLDLNGASGTHIIDYINVGGNRRFVVNASSGNVQNTNNAYGQLSDSKIKENIVDATNKLEDLKKVKVKNFNMKGDEQKQIGVIAQELESIFPSMVEDHKDYDEEGEDLGTVTKSVKYSVFVPILIKAIQEQQTIIEDLKSRIETLEG